MADKKKLIGQALSRGLMAMGQGITGQPFLTSYDNSQLARQNQLAEQKYREWQMKNQDLETASMNKLREAQANLYQNGVPFYSIGMDGQPVYGGNIPKGSVVRQSPEALLELAKAKSEIPTTDMKNALKSAQQAGSLIQDLQQQASVLKGGYDGIGELGKMALNRGAGESANYKLYMDTLPSASVSFYRAVTGDTRLSDSDAKARALPLLWHPSEAEDVKTKKFDFLNRMIVAREKLLNSGKYKADDVIPLSALKKEAETVGKSYDHKNVFEGL